MVAARYPHDFCDALLRLCRRPMLSSRVHEARPRHRRAEVVGLSFHKCSVKLRSVCRIL